MTVPGSGPELQFPAHEYCNRHVYKAFLVGFGAEAILDGPSNAALSDCAVRGGYRKLIGRPLDFNWEICSHTKQSEELTATDFDALEPKVPAHQSADAGPALPEDAAATADRTGARGDAPVDADPSYTAVIQHFSLFSKTS